MNNESEIKVWDPLVRLFHWGLAGSFAIAYITEDHFMRLHSWAGYTLLGLILVRLVWGFIGPRHARFSDFVHRPETVIRYLKEELALRAKRYLGHNPAGGAMVVALLLCLTGTAFSGLLLYGAAEFSGPLASLMAGTPGFLAKALEELHELLAHLSLLLVGLHLAGVLFASRLHNENLVRAMITGYKRRAS
jgi:cytochrome b